VGLGEAEELDTITALPHSGSSLDPRLRRTRAAPKARSANSGPSSFLRSALRASLDPKYTQRYFHAKVVPVPVIPLKKGPAQPGGDSLLCEADILSIEAHQPLIRDTDPVGIATEILKDVLGPATWSRPSCAFSRLRPKSSRVRAADSSTRSYSSLDSAVPTRAVPGAV